jgi:hypothetical protein
MTWTSDVHLPSPNCFSSESTPEICPLAGIHRKIILWEYGQYDEPTGKRRPVTDPIPTALEPFRFERSFMTEPGYASAVTKGLLRYVLLARRRVVTQVIILVVFVVIGIVGSYSGELSWGVLALPGLYLLVYVVTCALIYLVFGRQMRARIPTDSVFSIGFRSNTFTVRSPQVSSEVAYRYYRSAERRGDFVLLRARATGAGSLVPAEILTDESLAFLQAKIAGLPTQP